MAKKWLGNWMNTDRWLEHKEKYKLKQYDKKLSGLRLMLTAGLLLMWLPMSFAAETTILNFKGADLGAVMATQGDALGAQKEVQVVL